MDKRVPRSVRGTSGTRRRDHITRRGSGDAAGNDLRSPRLFALHLEAALALWRYSESSVRFIWGDSLGDPAADALLRQLRQQPDGMTRTEIRDFFHRNKKSSETDRVLELLLSLNLITCETETTTGRPVTRFIANRYVSVSSVPISKN